MADGMNFSLTPQQYALLYQQQQQQGTSGTSGTNTAGQGETVAGGVLSGLGGIASLIPGVGSIIGAGLGIVGGALDKAAAAKQQNQAQSDLNKANTMQPAPLPKGFQEKQVADQFAANSPIPGWTQQHDVLMQNLANHLRAISLNSRNGAQALGAIGTSLGISDEAMDKLFATNVQYQGKLGETARQDLWDLGKERQQNVTNLYDRYQKPLYEQATALQNAATANNQTGNTKAINSAITGIDGFLNNLNKEQVFNKLLGASANTGPVNMGDYNANLQLPAGGGTPFGGIAAPPAGIGMGAPPINFSTGIGAVAPTTINPLSLGVY